MPARSQRTRTLESTDTTSVAKKPRLTGLILAGGQGRRMGGMDKGLVVVAGRPMVCWAGDRLAPQVDEVLVSANRNQHHYRRLGYRVVSDGMANYQGPLAGIASGLEAARSPWLLVVPCDSPLASTELAARLGESCRQGAQVAVAHDGERLQPVFAMLQRSLLPSLLEYLGRGERKIDRWYAGHRMQEVDFSDCPESFLNINDPGQRDGLERRLTGEGDNAS